VYPEEQVQLNPPGKLVQFEYWGHKLGTQLFTSFNKVKFYCIVFKKIN
jgi:hypothetical protein